jgi:CBS domain-containing membrane protein
MFFRRFLPTALMVSKKEKLRMTLGAGIGILFVGAMSQFWSNGLEPWLVAPIGASALLVFCLPSSPLAQPWAVVVGNTLSALVGVAMVLIWPHHLAFTAAIALTLAIAVMLLSRSLHPPGGAVALLVVLMHQSTLSFVLFPVLFNSVFLVIAGLIYNNLTARAYPHHLQAEPDPVHSAQLFTQSDLDAALSHYQQIIDVDPSDLAQLLQYAESAAYQRALGDLRCEDVMKPAPLAMESGASLSDAWQLMRHQQIKALPVVDGKGQVVGVITLEDFLKHAQTN